MEEQGLPMNLMTGDEHCKIFGKLYSDEMNWWWKMLTPKCILDDHVLKVFPLFSSRSGTWWSYWSYFILVRIQFITYVKGPFFKIFWRIFINLDIRWGNMNQRNQRTSHSVASRESGRLVQTLRIPNLDGLTTHHLPRSQKMVPPGKSCYPRKKPGGSEASWAIRKSPTGLSYYSWLNFTIICAYWKSVINSPSRYANFWLQWSQ